MERRSKSKAVKVEKKPVKHKEEPKKVEKKEAPKKPSPAKKDSGKDKGKKDLKVGKKDEKVLGKRTKAGNHEKLEKKVIKNVHDTRGKKAQKKK